MIKPSNLTKNKTKMNKDIVSADDDKQWYAAIVGTNQEKTCRDRLIKMGYKAWIASQQEKHVWRNGRHSQVERVVIPLVVFVYATEEERRQIVNYPFIKCFLTDKARTKNKFGIHPVATISDCEMEKLRFMLYQSEKPITFISRSLHTGDTIRVVRGNLQGFEGHVIRYHDGNNYVVANIGILGCAMVRIALSDVEPLK